MHIKNVNIINKNLVFLDRKDVGEATLCKESKCIILTLTTHFACELLFNSVAICIEYLIPE